MNRRAVALLASLATLMFASVTLAAPTCASAHCIYLPVARGGGVASAMLVPNGDFEGGATFWGVFPTSPSLITDTLTLPVVPHSGTHVVVLQASSHQIDRELDSDTFTIPTDMPYLSYWIWIRSTESTCGDDTGVVIINNNISGTQGDPFNLCAATQTTGWVKHVVEIHRFAGQSVVFALVAASADTDPVDSTLFIDDVGLQATP